jgi:hypothetical protein
MISGIPKPPGGVPLKILEMAGDEFELIQAAGLDPLWYV